MKIHNPWRKRKKGTEEFTFIILPASAAQPVKINLSTRIIGGFLLVVFLFAAGSLATIYKYYSSQADIRRVESIKQENRNKDRTIKKMADEIKAIDKQQRTLEKKQMLIKKMMGIKNENTRSELSSRGGKGGPDLIQRPGIVTDGINTTQQIKNNITVTEKELDELLGRVKGNQSYFRSLPNQWPTEGEISSSFGWRTSPFGRRQETFHDGLDLANNVGTPVIAAGDGTVILAGWKPVYGKCIEINHGHGLVTKYGHNAKLLVKVGDKVKKGDTIALMGSTGRSTGPHLHFTLFKNGVAQDPLIYLPD